MSYRLTAHVSVSCGRARDVGYRPGPMHIRHPQLGDLHLHRTRLRVPHSDGQHMLVYHAGARQRSQGPSARGITRARPKGFETPSLLTYFR